MISFRVSEDEFMRLKTKSEAEGARSVSEFARLTLCEEASGGAPAVGRPSADAEQLTQLRDDVQELRNYVRRVAELIERGRTPVPLSSPFVAVGAKASIPHKKVLKEMP